MKELQFGIGRSCITPKEAVGLGGYFTVRMFDQVLNDLEVQVLIFEQDGVRAAVIQFDLVSTNNNFLDPILARIAEFGLHAENTLFTATHSHTAPEVRPERDGFSGAYIALLVEQTVAAVCQAASSMTVADECFEGLCSDHRFQFNRRYWMKEGHVVTNPGKLNPQIEYPEGEIDPEIPLFALYSKGKLKLLLANIVNHSDTTGGCGVSADWPGETRRRIMAQLPDCAGVFILTGCAGNINHFDVRTDADQTSPAEANRIGAGYAQTILDNLCEMKKSAAGATLKVRHQFLPIPPRELFPEELQEAQETIARYPEIDVVNLGANSLTSEDLARKTPVVLKYFAVKLLEVAADRAPKPFHYVQLELGNTVLAGLPGEPFVEIGLSLRKNTFAHRHAMMLELANGIGGYIPNCWNYRRGGYETTPRSNPLSRHTAQLLLDTIAKLNQE